MNRPADRRLAVILAAALCFAVGPSARAVEAPAPPDRLAGVATAPVPVDAVTWRVDEDAKTITATVRIRIGTACSSMVKSVIGSIDPRLARRCTVDGDVAQAIAANIESVWNAGHTYRCYLLVVKVDVEVDPHGADERSPIGGDRVFIAVDRSPGDIESIVRTTEVDDAKWDSSRPEDRLVPTNGDDPPSTWAYPPDSGDVSLYAHEAAHILGLEDAYETYRGADGKDHVRLRPGAPNDVLANVRTTQVDQKTIDRLVGRSGLFAKAKPRCDYRIDTTIDWYRFRATKCGGPEGDWTIDVSGRKPIGAGHDLKLDGQGIAVLKRDPKAKKDPFTGTWNAAYGIALDPPIALPRGGKQTGGQLGSIAGKARLRGSVLQLRGTRAKGSFWSQNPYRSITGSTDPLKSFDLPVENGSFCP